MFDQFYTQQPKMYREHKKLPDKEDRKEQIKSRMPGYEPKVLPESQKVKVVDVIPKEPEPEEEEEKEEAEEEKPKQEQVEEKPKPVPKQVKPRKTEGVINPDFTRERNEMSQKILESIKKQPRKK